MLVGVLKMWCFPKKECLFCQVTKDNPRFKVVVEVRFPNIRKGGHVLTRLLGVFVELLLTYYKSLEQQLYHV